MKIARTRARRARRAQRVERKRVRRMGLTGEGFLVLVIVGVVLLPLTTILLWSRIPGPRLVKLGSRLSLILLSQAMAVLLAALWINNTYQLYNSWSDLLGDNGGTGSIQAATPQTAPAALTAKGGGRPGTLYNAKLFGQLTGVEDGYQTTITGPESGIVGNVMVWLPPQYTQAAYAHTRFPVIQLLSGNPGSPQTWLEGMQAPKLLAQEVKNGDAHPFVLVSASINVDGRHNPDCSNIPGGPQVATWLATDVRDLVQSSFRVATGRDGWGLMGYSEGGLCATKLALQYSGEYTAAVSISGDDHPDGDLLKPGSTAYNENAPLWLLKHRPAVDVSLLLTGTRQDSDISQEASAMVAAAHSPTTVETLISPRGGHNIGVWKSVEPQSFAWLSQHLSAPATSTYSAFPEMLGHVTG